VAFTPLTLGMVQLILEDRLKLIVEYIFPGLSQAGLASTVAFSISQLPADLQGMFWENIGLMGGNVKLPGFRKRL